MTESRYIACMKNLSSNGSEAQGADVQEDGDITAGVPDVATVEKWLTKDLGTCITFLTALHNDAELRRQMAIFLQGRLSNFKEKPDPKQGNLFGKQAVPGVS